MRDELQDNLGDENENDNHVHRLKPRGLFTGWQGGSYIDLNSQKYKVDQDEKHDARLEDIRGDNEVRNATQESWLWLRFVVARGVHRCRPGFREGLFLMLIQSRLQLVVPEWVTCDADALDSGM